MKWMPKANLGIAALVILTAIPARAEVLTADRAVEIALQRSSGVIQSQASLLDARSGLLNAYSGILPHLSADVSRSGQWTKNSIGNAAFGGVAFPPRTTFEDESYFTNPVLSANWAVLDLSNLIGFSAARSSVKAAKFSHESARQDVAFAVRRQFYLVVTAIRLSQVATVALGLSRDDERRVRALYEVGSVSKSDLLKAQVRTAQSELDSLTASQLITNQRINLAEQMGIREPEIGDVDTVMTAEVPEYDEAQLVTEAVGQRPDIQAAEANVKAAGSSVTSAKLARFPAVFVSGSATFKQISTSQFDQPELDSAGNEIPGTRFTSDTRNEVDRIVGGRVGVTWNIFDGLNTDSRIASAQAFQIRAKDTRDALRRNLESDIHQALFALREAVARNAVARRAFDSAVENLKLVREKYNVGSSTILDLIDAQVQLQRAASDGVSALAQIRIAEAQLARARGLAL
jgi:outer membrane protein